MSQDTIKKLQVKVLLDGRVEVSHEGMDTSEAVVVARSLVLVLENELQKRMQTGLVVAGGVR